MLWSFIESFTRMGIGFAIGIILARLLSPEEFGLIGMLTVFLAVAGTFTDAGFTQALIRKQDCTDTDFSTVFYFNLGTGVCLYGLLFIFAPYVAAFYEEPELTSLLRVLGCLVIINSFTIIQRTILTKRVDFKLQAKISVITTILSGILGIYMAFKGFGVWSLVAKNISQSILASVFLWLWNQWRPILVFSKESFTSLFGFGSKLMVSSLIDTLGRNIYLLVVGKVFSAEVLGYYTRAMMFRDLPSSNLSAIIARVSFPVLSQLQGDTAQLKAAYRRLITSSMLIAFVLMLGMAASAEAMIITLIGEQWRESIILLQSLCIVGMLYPLHSLNLNMLNVQGRSDLFLRLEIIKKTMIIPVVLIGMKYGLLAMISGMMVTSIIAYFLNSYWSGREIDYSSWNQIVDILPSFLVAATMAGFVYLLGQLLDYNYFVIFALQVLAGGISTVLLCEIFKLEAYRYIKATALAKLLPLLKNVSKRQASQS